jgi:hypothetical protein
MDQHPIPQDVTGFQFKLIGTMTVKQFGYVAVGAILAVVLYYLPINSAFGILLKVFLIPLLGASGVVVAFVPIDGRSIDVMATNFVKALFSPNQYVYKHQGRKMSFSSVTTVRQTEAQKNAQAAAKPNTAASQSIEKQQKLQAFLLSAHGGVKNELDKKEASFLKSFAPVTPTSTAAAAPKFTPIAQKSAAQPMTLPKPLVPTQQATYTKPAVTPLPAASSMQSAPAQSAPMSQAPMSPTAAPEPNTNAKETAETLAQKEQLLEQELAKAKQEEISTQAPAVHQKVETLANQIDVIHAQKVQLEQELAKLQSQLSQQKTAPAVLQPAPVQPSAPAAAPIEAKQTIPLQDPKLIKVVAKEAAEKKSDVPRVSDTPNVVVGIVKDPRGNVLSNILVEVKDKSGNPVRAFKTNPLGQFASATPLSPGVYTMELEDPKNQHKFDVIQITANNEIMRPIEIISHDAREALRQQLFS